MSILNNTLPSDQRDYQTSQANNFQELVIVHAAVNSGMITNFGRFLAKRLVNEGVQLHVFGSRQQVFGQTAPINDLQEIGATFHGLPIGQGFALLQSIRSLVQMTIALRRLNVQIIHTRSSVMGAIGRIAGKLAGVPVIIHHQDDLYCRDTQLSPWSKRILATLEKWLSFLADRSLFISETVLNEAIAIGFDKERCVLVWLDLHEVFQQAAVETEQSKEPVYSLLKQKGVREDAKIVGCVGRLAHLKGIDLFVEAVRQLAPEFPEWDFVIKGNGPLRNSLLESIQNYGLSSRVFLITEELPHEQMPALYRCFDCFTLPTRREGFGMVFAEAMAMGVPVVAPDLPPVTEVVPADCGVLVQPENSEALAQGLRELMSDAVLRHELAEKGRQFSLETWGGQKAAERALSVYRDVLSEKK